MMDFPIFDTENIQIFVEEEVLECVVLVNPWPRPIHTTVYIVQFNYTYPRVCHNSWQELEITSQITIEICGVRI